MRNLYVFFLALSIFGASPICKAQIADYSMRICNVSAGQIYLSQLKEILGSNFGNISVFDESGKELLIKEFKIGAVPDKKVNAFLTYENGNKLNSSAIKNLANLSAGDEFLVQDIIVEENGKRIVIEKVFSYKISK